MFRLLGNLALESYFKCRNRIGTPGNGTQRALIREISRARVDFEFYFHSNRSSLIDIVTEIAFFQLLPVKLIEKDFKVDRLNYRFKAKTKKWLNDQPFAKI